MPSYAPGLDGPPLRASDPPPTSDPVFNNMNLDPAGATIGTSTGGSAIASNGSNSPATPLGDARAGLHRRFTTNTLAAFALQSGYPQSRDQQPFPDAAYQINQKLPPSERKKQEYEYLRQKQMQRQSQMDQLSMEKQREDLHLNRLSRELGMGNSNAASSFGHQSEPTTPPEYEATNGFPTAFSRPNRFSASSSQYRAPYSRPDSQHLASPPSERARAYEALTAGTSLPQTRNQSDEDDTDRSGSGLKDRLGASNNRKSLPVTRRDRGRGMHLSTTQQQQSPNLGLVDTTTFLFEDDDDHHHSARPPSTSTSNRNSYLQMNETDDNFPILVRRNGGTSRYSGSSALDMSSPPEMDATKPSWRTAGSRQTLPSNFAMNAGLAGLSENSTFNNGSNGNNTTTTAGDMSQDARVLNRRSLGAKLSGIIDEKPDTPLSPPSTGTTTPSSHGQQPKLQSSLSTNDIPTVRSLGAVGTAAPQPQGPVNTLTDQAFHNHNVSMGRIPGAPTSSNRQSREYTAATAADPLAAEPQHMPIGSGNANANVNALAAAADFDQVSAEPGNNANMQQAPAGFNAQGQNIYNMYALQNQLQMMNAAMNSLSMQTQWHPNMQFMGQHVAGYQQYQQMPANRAMEAPGRTPAQRRFHNEDPTRFTNVELSDLEGQIYSLCKDQHGCRFLQRKLEEGNAQQIEMIFLETKDHMVELMTDPFGNYLCQKLLEHTESAQHTVLIENAAPHMIHIALNQHGTRALQKMIEYVKLPSQISAVIVALKDQVVPMIQDLNGNHVIQKCLNRLSDIASEHAQFIFDAVSNNCVAVGTHRHGCCVIQRCLDHASEAQKAQLMNAIIDHAFPLVQDPFGNYVLQYIFDQNMKSFSQRLCRAFLGSVVNLSKQKFSSNVMEKCIRNADIETRHLMIDEVIRTPDFDRIADDAFANYVLQTALDNAEAEDEARLVERLRPILPRIRNRPYGRRITTRIAERDRRMGVDNSGSMTPVEVSSPDSLSGGMSPANSNLPSYHRAGRSSGSNIMQSPPVNYGHISMPAPLGATMQQQFGAHAPMAPNADFIPAFNQRRFTNPPAFQNTNQFQIMSQLYPGFQYHPRGNNNNGQGGFGSNMHLNMNTNGNGNGNGTGVPPFY